MDNITRLKAEAAMHAMLMLLNELDRVHGSGYTKAFVEDHQPVINAALAAIEHALEHSQW
jgi:roadblock/LC7 domain-containing protein